MFSKEYERLGRAYYKQSNANSFENAKSMLTQLPFVAKYRQSVVLISDSDLEGLHMFSSELKWIEQGQYWRTDNIKELTNFLAKFREEN